MAGTREKDRYIDTARASDARKAPRPKDASPVPPSCYERDRDRDYEPFGG